MQTGWPIRAASCSIRTKNNRRSGATPPIRWVEKLLSAHARLAADRRQILRAALAGEPLPHCIGFFAAILPRATGNGGCTTRTRGTLVHFPIRRSCTRLSRASPIDGREMAWAMRRANLPLPNSSAWARNGSATLVMLARTLTYQGCSDLPGGTGPNLTRGWSAGRLDAADLFAALLEVT